MLIVRAVLGVKFGGMKTTRERLDESYCRPTTEQEWADILSANPNIPNKPSRFVDLKHDLAYIVDRSVLIFGRFDYHRPKMALRKEIKTERQVDLMRDRIAPWRLVEDGFRFMFDGWIKAVGIYYIEIDQQMNVKVTDDNDLYIDMDGIKSYTDLLTLIRLIG